MFFNKKLTFSIVISLSEDYYTNVQTHTPHTGLSNHEFIVDLSAGIKQNGGQRMTATVEPITTEETESEEPKLSPAEAKAVKAIALVKAALNAHTSRCLQGALDQLVTTKDPECIDACREAAEAIYRNYEIGRLPLGRVAWANELQRELAGI